MCMVEVVWDMDLTIPTAHTHQATHTWVDHNHPHTVNQTMHTVTSPIVHGVLEVTEHSMVIVVQEVVKV
tara:strand:- start:315 stop:521 length:207 start_codon:yes stop_codon:yes gene_type:complete